MLHRASQVDATKAAQQSASISTNFYFCNILSKAINQQNRMTFTWVSDQRVEQQASGEEGTVKLAFRPCEASDFRRAES